MTLCLSVRTGGHAEATVARSNNDDLDLCPYCGGDWKPPQAVATLSGWVVAHCTTCDATKLSASGHGDPPR